MNIKVTAFTESKTFYYTMMVFFLMVTRLWSVSVPASAALQVIERLTYYGAKLSVPLVYKLAGKLEEKLHNRQERKVVMALPLPFVKESFMVRIIMCSMDLWAHG